MALFCRRLSTWQRRLGPRRRRRSGWSTFSGLIYNLVSLSFLPSRVADTRHIDADPNPSFHLKANLYHFNVDPDPFFHFKADPDLTFRFNADPVPNPDPATGLQTSPPPLSQGSIFSLYASNVSVQGPPWLHFELLKLRNFDFNADPDPASRNNADPDPQPCYRNFKLHEKIEYRYHSVSYFVDPDPLRSYFI
jgi:hypothetical protein